MKKNSFIINNITAYLTIMLISQVCIFRTEYYKLLINLCLEIKIIIYLKTSDINIFLTRTYEPFCD